MLLFSLQNSLCKRAHRFHRLNSYFVHLIGFNGRIKKPAPQIVAFLVHLSIFALMVALLTFHAFHL